MTAPAFYTALKRVAYARAKDTARGNLAGVNLDPTDGGRLVATDVVFDPYDLDRYLADLATQVKVEEVE